MNIYKKRIIEMMRYKSSIVSFGDVIYFTDEDEKDIKRWKNDICEIFITNSSYLCAVNGYDIGLCPFCLKYGFQKDYNSAFCDKCSYGKRHGKCIDLGSTYRIIIKAKGTLGLWHILNTTQQAKTLSILKGE